MQKFKKLLVASLVLAASVFSASICAHGAQIDSLSIVDNTIYATVTAENARLYVAEHNGGLLSDVFFTLIGEDGNVELPVGEASEYSLYLWDKDSLAPVSATYKLTDGVAYMEGSTEPVPAYEFPAYSFNQEDDVMIVSAITESEIKGFKAGVETTYSLADDVVVLGLSDSLTDVVPGSVVLIGTDKGGTCSAIELLATIGVPVDKDVFTSNFGVRAAADGSTKYKNIVTSMHSKSGLKITTQNGSDQPKIAYYFASASIQCYRVGIAMDGETPVITYTNNVVSATGDSSMFRNTSKYYNLLYFRYDTEQQKKISDGVYSDGVVTQCVLYCVPKDYDPGKGDGEYSDIFNLEPMVIIE